MSELLPCPFCGNSAIIRKYDGEWYIRCYGNGSCHANPFYADPDREIVCKRWNTRAPSAGEAEVRGELKRIKVHFAEDMVDKREEMRALRSIADKLEEAGTFLRQDLELELIDRRQINTSKWCSLVNWNEVLAEYAVFKNE